MTASLLTDTGPWPQKFKAIKSKSFVSFRLEKKNDFKYLLQSEIMSEYESFAKNIFYKNQTNIEKVVVQPF